MLPSDSVVPLESAQSHPAVERLRVELLRQSEERYRTLFEAAPMAVFVCDRNSVIQQYNTRAVELWGREPVCGVEKHCGSVKLWLPNGTLLPHPQSPIVEVLRTGVPANNVEVHIERPDGSRVPVLVDFAALRSAAGEVTGAITSFVDITERKRAEEALRQSEQRQRFAMESMPQKIFTAKPNGQIDYFNPQWTEFTGLPFEQIRDWGWTQFIHPDDVAENVRVWQHAIDAGEPFQFEHRFRRADGEYRWHISRALPLRDDAGAVLMWVGSNTDVHDIKQAEAALHESEVRYRRLFESAQDGILILDGDTARVRDANPFMSELLGYSHADFLGKELWEIGLFSDKSANVAAVRELQDKGYIRYDHLFESTAGRRVEVEVVANAYRENHRGVIQCNIRDITARSRLERQAKEQTAELSDLHRRKDEFLAMLSHELRNPLAPIANAVQLLRLQRGQESPVAEQARNIIERQVGQLTHLVDDLLEVSRITTGRVWLRQEQVAVSGIVERALETTRQLFARRRQELTLALPPQPMWLYADAARLEQVVVNLLTNAAKYTDEGGHVWLSVAQEGDAAVLRVRDTGVGIAPEFLPRIFELFTQAERSLDRSQGGLGIGLSLVQRLVELHGGTAEAYSTLGQGSEFVVRLPMIAMPLSLPPATETPPLPEKFCRVLLVDDNVDLAQSLAALLRASRHEVRMAHEGSMAVDIALDYKPDVVLLDIGLPGLDGFEVAKRIRHEPTLKDTLLVAMTGYGQEAVRQRSQGVGFDHYLVKPADFQRVQGILASVAEKAA